MPNVMAVLGIYMAPSVENDEEQKFYNSIPCTMPKVWLTPTHPVPCSNTAKAGERKTWTQSEFYTWQNSVRGKSPRKCTYSILAQKMTKHRAKFG